MFKKNSTSNRTVDKNEKLGKKLIRSGIKSSSPNGPLVANNRQYADEFIKNYNKLNQEELQHKATSKHTNETVVLHRYELRSTKEDEESSSDNDESYYKFNHNYLALNKFDRLVYRLTGILNLEFLLLLLY